MVDAGLGIKLIQSARHVRHPDLVRSRVHLPHSEIGRLRRERDALFEFAQSLFLPH